MRILVAALWVLYCLPTFAQTTCQRVGNATLCADGSSSQDVGNSTFYSYPSGPTRGLPSSSQQIGNTRYYDNGITRQSTGNVDFYSNGATRQRQGGTEFYSNGRTCQTIGSTRLCN